MKFNIVGTVYYADGFDFTIEAATEEEARTEARRMIEDEDEDYKPNTELQEICIETVVELP